MRKKALEAPFLVSHEQSSLVSRYASIRAVALVNRCASIRAVALVSRYASRPQAKLASEPPSASIRAVALVSRYASDRTVGASDRNCVASEPLR